MSSPDRINRIVPALASAVGDAVAALLGESTTTSPILNGGEAGWTAAVTADGALRGEVTIGLPEADARRISALITGLDGEPEDEAVLDTLREICNQAIGAISQQEVGAGIAFAVAHVARAGTPVVEAEHAFEFSVQRQSMRLFVHAALTDAQPSAAPSVAAVAGLAAGQSAPVSTQNLEVLLDVALPVSVRFGQTELQLQALMRLGPGAVVDLHRTADEPVDVLVGGKIIARGEVVVVEGNYGVRVLQIVSAAERIKSLGA